MASSMLHPRHLFGVNAAVSNGVSFMDEGVVVYPAGHCVVVLNAPTQIQKIIPLGEESEAVTAMAVSNSKRYVAVAEQMPQRASISVFDLHTLKRRKNFKSSEVQSKRYESLCFSADNKLLLSLSGGPDYSLVAWQWEKSKALAVIKVALPSPASRAYQCSCSPLERSVALVTGDGTCSFYRVQDSEFKVLPSLMTASQEEKYLCHAWLPEDRAIVGSDAGNIILLESGNFNGVLECSPADGIAIRCMTTHSTGFLCGCDGGIVRLFAKVETGDGSVRFKLQKTFRIHGHTKAHIAALGIGPAEDVAVVTTSDQQMFKLALTGTDVMKESDMNFEILSQDFHGVFDGSGDAEGSAGGDAAISKMSSSAAASETPAAITGMDTCARKPLVVTVGRDRTLRIWNYLSRKCELRKEFTEECFSVAMHPSGLHVLVGCSDKLRLMNVLMDDIRPCEGVLHQGVQGVQVFRVRTVLCGCEWQRHQCLPHVHLRAHFHPPRPQQ